MNIHHFTDKHHLTSLTRQRTLVIRGYAGDDNIRVYVDSYDMQTKSKLLDDVYGELVWATDKKPAAILLEKVESFLDGHEDSVRWVGSEAEVTISIEEDEGGFNHLGCEACGAKGINTSTFISLIKGQLGDWMESELCSECEYKYHYGDN